jgi:hypothetical protein
VSPLTSVILALGLMGFALAQPTPEPSKLTPAQVAQFEAKVRPLLLAKCGLCHSGQSPQAGLDLSKPLTMREVSL